MHDYSHYAGVLTQFDAGVLTVTLNRPDQLNAFSDEMHQAMENIWEDIATDPDVRAIVLTGAGRSFTVTLNRPDQLNAFSDEMHQAMENIWEDIATDPDVRAIVLTGAGRSFSSGGDIRMMKERAGLLPRSTHAGGLAPGGRRLVRNMLEVHQPIVAAINGDAVGLGATLALMCDITVMAENARIGDPHARVGLVAGDGGAVIWPLLVGVNHAKEMLMTGRLLRAPEAQQMGLVNRVTPEGQALAEALEVARELANGATLAIRWSKASVNKVLKDRLNLILDTSLAWEALTMVSDDHLEAATAFVEKRKPQFQGR